MKLKVFARVGCQFSLDCEPTHESITKALKQQVETIPFANGETYIPCDADNHITTETGEVLYLTEDVEFNAIGQPKTLYFLFGSIACRNFDDMELDEFCKHIEYNGFDGALFKWSSGDVIELLEQNSGWDEYCIITKEQFETISETDY